MAEKNNNTMSGPLGILVVLLVEIIVFALGHGHLSCRGWMSIDRRSGNWPVYWFFCRKKSACCKQWTGRKHFLHT